MGYDKKKWIQVTVPMTSQEHDALIESAAIEGRSRASFCRRAILSALKKRYPQLVANRGG